MTESVTTCYRSLLDSVHDAAGAQWDSLGENRVVSCYGATAAEQSRAFGHLAIMDVSPLPRLGFKGVQIASTLTSRGMEISKLPNQTVVQDDGSLLIRLAMNEFLLLARPGRKSVMPDVDLANTGDGHSARDCYSVNRKNSHYWFAISGSECPSMLSKLCAVDLNMASFGNGCVAQTQVAKTSAIIVRCDSGQTPCYNLLGDSSYVSYMWACLLDAMAEFDGKILGTHAI